jgi:chemotaxis protein MotB
MKKPKPHKKGQPDWLATYSDMITLLMCFFVLLFAMSNVDEEKFDMLRQSFGDMISLLPGNQGMMLDAGPDFMPHLEVLHPDATEEEESEGDYPQMSEEEQGMLNTVMQQQELLGTMASEFKTYFAQEMVLGNDRTFEETGEGTSEVDGTDGGIQVEINVDGMFMNLIFPGSVLFDSGRANLKPDALRYIDLAADMMERYPNHMIRVEGHTDDVPMNTAQFPSNRHLSAHRAVAVVEHLVHNRNFDPRFLSAEGMSEYHPRVPNLNPDGTPNAQNRATNRRVEIKVYLQVREGEIIPVSD